MVKSTNVKCTNCNGTGIVQIEHNGVPCRGVKKCPICNGIRHDPAIVETEGLSCNLVICDELSDKPRPGAWRKNKYR